MLVSQRSRVLYDDLVLCYCVMLSYSVLIFLTTAAIPRRCRRSFHRHRHTRRTAAAATAAAAAAAAAAVRRLLCCGCGWCLLRLLLKIKNWLLCCGDDRGDRARPTCCAATYLAGPSPPPPPPLPPPLLQLRLRLRCCYCRCCCCRCCCCSHSLACSKSVLQSLLWEIDAAVRGFCTHDRMARFCDLCFYLWNFYRKLSQMHARVNLAFFKPDGRIHSDFFKRKHSHKKNNNVNTRERRRHISRGRWRVM